MNRMLTSVALIFPIVAMGTLKPGWIIDDFSPDIQPCKWSARSDLCMKYAKETGYPMLWFLTSKADRYSALEFIEKNLSRQAFCDIANQYGKIILCNDDYGSAYVRNLKNSIYGYPEPSPIFNERTQKYEENNNGYPVATTNAMTGKVTHCDTPPSLTLLKIDVTTNIIFHVCTKRGIYDKDFSPYYEKYPIPNNMCDEYDAFAPWFKQYLEIFPIEDTIASPVIATPSEDETVFYQQIAIHRDNVVCRFTTMLYDILVKTRFDDASYTSFGGMNVKNASGKWFVNHDDTISGVPTTEETAVFEVSPQRSGTFSLRQKTGDGFTLSSYVYETVTNVYQEVNFDSSGTSNTVVTTNIVVKPSETPYASKSYGNGTDASISVIGGNVYHISIKETSSFDLFFLQ